MSAAAVELSALVARQTATILRLLNHLRVTNPGGSAAARPTSRPPRRAGRPLVDCRQAAGAAEEAVPARGSSGVQPPSPNHHISLASMAAIAAGAPGSAPAPALALLEPPPAEDSARSLGNPCRR